MAPRDSLAEYRRRRDFGRTAEPDADAGAGPDAGPEQEPAAGPEREPAAGPQGEEGGTPGPPPVFVVQIHDASRLHFDFRLEVDGTLKSWAVPKGPSPDPHEKRLAVPTEDHPLEYRNFEGVIAEGEYGGGTVIVWDEGRYRNLSKDRSGAEIPFAEALRRGHASFWLDGAKLHGGYALTRIRNTRGQGEAWLLVKENDQRAAPGDSTPDPLRARSVRSGHTLRQVAATASGASESSDTDGSGSRSPHSDGSGSGSPRSGSGSRSASGGAGRGRRASARRRGGRKAG